MINGPYAAPAIALQQKSDQYETGPFGDSPSAG